MGRPAKTVDAADGAMSAKTRAARKNAEKSLQGSGRVIAPSYLTDSQKAIFDKIKTLLTDAGVIGSIDGYVMSFCAVAIDRVAEIDTMANEDMDLKINKDVVNARSKYMNDFYRCCNELCLSPQARAKLGVLAANRQRAQKDPLLKALEDDDG